MKKLFIIGAGGFAREVAWLVEEINKLNKEWELKGFIDEDTAKHGKILNGVPVVGDFSFFHANEIDEPIYAVCAVAKPRDKMKLVQKAVELGLCFTNLIHPSVIISSYVNMGEGNIICAGSIVTTNIKIGSHVSMNPGCGIGHDVIIGDYTTLYWDVNISGNVNIGNGCELGTKTVIIQGVTLGAWSITGAGAVVTRDIPPGCTAAGVPAKVIKYHNEDNTL